MNDRQKYGSIETAPLVIGVPGIDGKSSLVHQGYQDTCAIRCQELILRDFGIPVSENELCEEALVNGWYRPGEGTDPDQVGNLLELHGVDVNRYKGANIFTLTSELAKGHKVIIGVDSGELWNKSFWEGLEDKVGIQGADHALIVSGIDTSDSENVKVVLTDPGSGDIAKEYPMEQFVDAWKDSGCFMVATKSPAPLEFNPSMVNFDYDLGHIDSIGELPFDLFDSEFSGCIGLESDSSLISDQIEFLSKSIKDSSVIENLTVDTQVDVEQGYQDDSSTMLPHLDEILTPSVDEDTDDTDEHDDNDGIDVDDVEDQDCL